MAHHTYERRLLRLSAVLFLVLGRTEQAAPQSPPSIYQRQTTVQAAINGSHGVRDGNFSITGVSSICGEIPKEASLTGEAVFVVEFPSEPTAGSITSVAFGSHQLAAGGTQSTLFRLSVAVVTAAGTKPPLYVLNTDPPQPKNTGRATLTNANGVATLKVVGQNESGETIDFILTCTANVG